MIAHLKHYWRHYLRHAHARPFFANKRDFGSFVLVLLIVAWLAHWLAERGIFRMTEAQLQAALDIATLDNPAQLVKEIVVVPIQDTDLATRFDGQITAKNLYPFITKLDALGARTVVIDIDTSGPGFREHPLPTLHHATIVWAHGVEASHWNAQSARWQYEERPALEGKEVQHSGVAILEGSGDGIVDRYPHCLETKASVPVPALHWAAVAAYRQQEASTLCAGLEKNRSLGHEEVTRINQLHNRYTFNQIALEVLERADGSTNSVVQDRLVVIGGMFSRADRHRTPFGPKWGWELQAAAMAATLEDLQQDHPVVASGFRPLLELLGLELLLALVIHWMHRKLRHWLALIGTLAMLGLVFFFAAALAAWWSGFRIALLPFLIGMWLHQLIANGE